MEKSNTISIEVVYAKPDEACVITMQVPLGTTVEQSIAASHILTRFPEIDLQKNAVGIFSRRVSLTKVLEAGDRVEIYRPLLSDPKLARQKRVKQERKRKLISRNTL